MEGLGLLPPMDVIYASDLALASSNDSYDVEDVEISSLLYEHHGQWTCMRSTPLDLITRSKQLSGGQREVHLEFAMVEDRPRWLVCKYWDAQATWQHCYRELFLLGSAAHLRTLQGVYVPQLVGVYATSSGHICTAMEPPHNTSKGWTEADPQTTPVHVKQKVVQAYEEIHASGVLHGDVQLQHILVTDDEDICIVDWKSAKSLNPMPAIGLHQCTSADLGSELLQVKLLLEYEDPSGKEPARAEVSPATTTHHENRSRASGSPVSRRSSGPQSSPSVAKSADSRRSRYFDIPLLPLDLSRDKTRSRSPGAPLIIPILTTSLPPPFQILSPTPPSATAESVPFFTDPFAVAPTSPAYPPVEDSPRSPQQPSPPYTPPTRRQKTSRLQVRLAKIDQQIAQLQRERREVIEGLRHLEHQRSLSASLGKRGNRRQYPTATPKTSLALSDISSAPGGSPSRHRHEDDPVPGLEPAWDPMAEQPHLHLELPSSSRRKRRIEEVEDDHEDTSPQPKRLRIRESSVGLLEENRSGPSAGLQLVLEPDAASLEALFEPHPESQPSSPK